MLCWITTLESAVISEAGEVLDYNKRLFIAFYVHSKIL